MEVANLFVPFLLNPRATDDTPQRVLHGFVPDFRLVESNTLADVKTISFGPSWYSGARFNGGLRQDAVRFRGDCVHRDMSHEGRWKHHFVFLSVAAGRISSTPGAILDLKPYPGILIFAPSKRVTRSSVASRPNCRVLSWASSHCWRLFLLWCFILFFLYTNPVS